MSNLQIKYIFFFQNWYNFYHRVTFANITVQTSLKKEPKSTSKSIKLSIFKTLSILFHFSNTFGKQVVRQTRTFYSWQTPRVYKRIVRQGNGFGSHSGGLDKPSITKNSLFIRFSMFCLHFCDFFVIFLGHVTCHYTIM